MNPFDKMESAWSDVQEEIGVHFSGGVIEILGDDAAEKVITEFKKSDAEGRACLIRKTRELLNQRTHDAEAAALDAVKHTRGRKRSGLQNNLNAIRRFCHLTISDLHKALGVGYGVLYSDSISRRTSTQAAVSLGLHPVLLQADNRTLSSFADLCGFSFDFTFKSMENLLTHKDGNQQTQYAPEVWSAKIIETGYEIYDGIPPTIAVPSLIIGRHRGGKNGAKIMAEMRDKMAKDISGTCQIPNVIKRRIDRRFRKTLEQV